MLITRNKMCVCGFFFHTRLIIMHIVLLVTTKTVSIFIFMDWPFTVIQIFALLKENKGQVEIHFCANHHYATNAAN